jgi:hypothetical protein
MTRIASLKFAAAFVAVLSVPSLAMAQAAGGAGGGGGGDGGLTSAPEISHINLPPQRADRAGTPASVTANCSFELLRGRYCEPRPAR